MLVAILLLMRPIAAMLMLLVGAHAGCSESPAPDQGEPESEESPDPGGDESDPAPAPSQPGTLRLVSFNIKYGSESSLADVAGVIRSIDPDVVALQEVDKDATRSDVVYQSYRLGQLTGMASSFRSSLTFDDGGNYGLALLSKHPIVASTKSFLGEAGEPRTVTTWTVTIDGEEVHIANTHLSPNADQRTDQLLDLVPEIAELEPLAVLGDFNEVGGSPSLDPIVDLGYADAHLEVGSGPGDTFPAGVPNRRIDHVYVRSDYEVVATQVVESEASDHRPVTVDIALP